MENQLLYMAVLMKPKTDTRRIFANMTDEPIDDKPPRRNPAIGTRLRQVIARWLVWWGWLAKRKLKNAG